ncbi:PepSY domain-containing protein [Xylophilus rhododendri]|uniref:PepSY domain-containing protein n=1 Tax=Xylophilus rhododendri TaxID=2697032 RepID=A0A857J9P2_9BURK|nr:PepSY-associated TM helix domain-containing protein [Xylophilus rhododendri]QHJ00448.1 PepSY domain-containing protein [Xylophilus rhododendri]
MRTRAGLVLLHRWVGLVLAGFLLLSGLSGSLLAWNDELEMLFSPELFRAEPPTPEARPLDPLLLRERVQARYPQALALRVPLRVEPGRSQLFMLRPMPSAKGARPPALSADQVFVDPYTGRLLGDRKWGDISQGRRNLMPFVYRLHESFALGPVGAYAFGAVGLLWTLDCFVGAWLTLPVGTQPFSLRRWAGAWRVRRARGYKLHFDLHRAGGLWLWAMLFVIAWSSVAFNLPAVYDPVMNAAFSRQPGLETLARLPQPRLQPALAWPQALAAGRALMARQAIEKGFTVLEEKALIYDPARGLYRYDARTSRDIRRHGGNTRMALDGDTGALRGIWLPTGQASGDTLRTWLSDLHMASVGGWPMQLLLCATGLGVALLSVTGVLVWRRKRRARRAA